MHESLSYCGWYCKRCPGGDCTGCKSGGGEPGCAMRDCAKDKGVVTCAVCEAFPCETISPMLSQFPMLAAICGGIREKGLDKWIEEQEGLADIKYAFPSADGAETGEGNA